MEGELNEVFPVECRVFTPCEREEWLAFKQPRLSSTDVVAWMGYDRYRSPFKVFQEKMGRAPVSDSDHEVLWYGRAMERVTANRYATETGREVGYFHENHDIVVTFCRDDRNISTPDRYVRIPKNPQPGVLECKNHAEWRGKEWKDGIPIAVRIQLQHQMWVTGATWGSAAATIGGRKLVWADLGRSPDFIQVMEGEIRRFWKAVDGEADPPEPDASDLKEVSRAPVEEIEADFSASEKAYELAMDLWHQDRELARMRRQVRAMETTRNAVKARLRQTLGPVQSAKLMHDTIVRITPSGIVRVELPEQPQGAKT